MSRGNKTHPIRDGVVQALQGAGGILTEMSEAVSRASRDARAAAHLAGSSAAEAIDEVIRGAVQGIDGTHDDLAIAIQGITVGVVQGTRESGAEAVGTLVRSGRIVIQEMLWKEGDLAQAFQGLLKGAVQTAEELGMDVGATLSASARASVEAAEEWSAPAADQVGSVVEEALKEFRMKRGPSDRGPLHS